MLLVFYCTMAGKLFSWVFRRNPTSPTLQPKAEPIMPQPSQRKLWCAFSDNPDRVFSLSCTLGVDTIDDLKKMIWERNHWELDLYSVVSVVNMKDSLVQLHPRQQILSGFPPSKDTGIEYDQNPLLPEVRSRILNYYVIAIVNLT